MNSTKFAKYVFLLAGIYGLVGLTPQYFMETRISAEFPPAITHPEYYYGFLGVALAFQVLFIVISRDPLRLRPAMIAGVLEKLSFGVAAIALYAAGRLNPVTMGFGIFDLVLGALFVWVYVATAEAEKASRARVAER